MRSGFFQVEAVRCTWKKASLSEALLMDAISNHRITSRLNVAHAFASPGAFPSAPEFNGFPSLADTVWLTPPPAMPMSDTDLAAFMNKMREMKEQALRDRMLRGGSPTRPTTPDKDKEKQGPLDIKAHGYYEGEKLIAVREIRVFEVNNYRKRTYNTFPGGWPDNSLRMDNARVGKTYRVKVTWENGTSQEKDVTMDSPNGTSVDVWKY